jgi:hypothetical protein
MASIVTDLILPALRSVASRLHPRENLFNVGTLGALNAEVQAFCDGCSTVTLDLRGTFNLTVQVQGTVDGVNWQLIPVRPQSGGVYVAGVAGSAAGVWMASCAGYTKVRAFVTAWTSGAATATISASNALFDDFAKNGSITSQIVTATGAAAAAVTATLAAPGAGLRHYLTYLSMTRVNGTAAALTASATPVVCTTTNLPGSLAFTRAADALAAGAADHWREDFAYPLMSNAQATATTIVCPATTGVIWRVTAGYFVAP